MSDYFRQNALSYSFKHSNSWVILSGLENQIKEKIDNIGTPLKSWNLRINYGIKTGYNDAFIIDEKIRNELIAKDAKSAEIIRPLLRGRDIKRYSYEFSELYIITTFPSLKIDIENYPAVRQHLLSFGYDRLKQTGDVGARKKTNNKWFETQDSISYWEDFYRQKIVWAELARTGNSFTIDNNQYLLGNTGYIMVVKEGYEEEISYEYLISVLNSKVILFYLDMISSRLDETGWRWLRQYVELLPLPIIDMQTQSRISEIVRNELKGRTAVGQSTIDTFVFDLYGFNEEEITFLNNFH